MNFLSFFCLSEASTVSGLALRLVECFMILILCQDLGESALELNFSKYFSFE